ncbi:MAG TPA: NAD(P)H-binding protein [Chryseolinea sp.]
MYQNNKLAVIGGTGKSGKYLVSQLLIHGFSLKLLLRNPETFERKNPFIEIVKGDARNYDSVDRLVDGCQCVISTLGQPRGETSIFSQATSNVIRAMTQHEIQRYVLTTGLSVDTPLDKKSQKVKMATDWMKSNFPETTLDKQVEFDVLSRSDIKWTLVRLPLIEQTDERRNMIASLEDCPGDKISTTDLAYFLIEQLSAENYIKKAPFLANA